MFWRIVYTVWLREIIRFWRDKSRLITSLATPFIWLAFMGTGFSSVFSGMDIGLDYGEFLAPGIVGMTLLFTSIFTGVSVIWDRQFGFLREMLVAPASRTSLVFGKITGSSTIVLINGLMIFGLAILVGAIPISAITLSSIVLVLLFMILVSFVFVSVGLILAARMKSMEGFQMIMSFVVMPLFLLSGAFFPLDNLPPWMKILTRIDPLSYGVDGIRGALLGIHELPLSLDLLILAAIGAVLLFIATMLFRKMEA